MILAIDAYDWVAEAYVPVACWQSARDIAESVGILSTHPSGWLGRGEYEIFLDGPIKIARTIVFDPYDRSYGSEWRSRRLAVRVMTLDPENSLNAPCCGCCS